jgi:hypothetical protein
MRHRTPDRVVPVPNFENMESQYCRRWWCGAEFKGRDATEALKTHVDQEHRTLRRILMLVIPMSVLASLAGWFIPRVL